MANCSIENYYKEKLENARKRRRQSDLDDSIVLFETPDDKVKELQEEVKYLRISLLQFMHL